MSYELLRATSDNKLLDECEKQWITQLVALGDEGPDGYFDMPLSYAKSIVDSLDRGLNDDYGIYLLKNNDTNNYDYMAHINYTLKNTKDATLKIIWGYLSPENNTTTQGYDIFAKINASFIIGVVELWQKTMPAKEVKIYLPNPMDRRAYSDIAAMINISRDDIRLETKGNWGHISGVDSLT